MRIFETAEDPSTNPSRRSRFDGELLDVATGEATFLQILLVVVFGGVERYCGHNVRGDRLGKSM
jgi:hypothetical protein